MFQSFPPVLIRLKEVLQVAGKMDRPDLIAKREEHLQSRCKNRI